MSKKSLIFGLLVAMLAWSTAGVFSASSVRADYLPYGSLYCTPATQSINSGDWVGFSAYYSYGSVGANQLNWSASSGSPANGVGTSFGTRFYTNGTAQTFWVSVSDGMQTATCTVYVSGNNGYPYPYITPTSYYPYQQTLQCLPSYSTIAHGNTVSLSATGGNGSYTWSALEGSPVSGVGSSFSTRLFNYNSYTTTRYITVSSAGQNATCSVQVMGSYYFTPTPTPYYTYVSMNQTVSNTTRGGNGTSVIANSGDRLTFLTTVTTGGQYASNVRVQNVLPQYIGYVPGTTTVNGVRAADAITGGGLTLATIQPNQTVTIRFDAMVQYAPYLTTTLGNTVNLWGDGIAMLTRTTKVYLNGAAYTNPYLTPTPYYPYPTYTPVYAYTTSNSQIGLSVTGRNVSLGQTAEYTSVKARANDTVDLIVRIRNTSNATLNNVFITDLLPAGVSYVAGSTTVNGSVVADGITSSGLNIGSVSPGQIVRVKLNARVDGAYVPSVGQVVVNNTIQVRADTVGTVSAQLPLVLGQTFIGGIAGVQTGPADSLLLALAISVLITAGYALYTRTGVFGRRLAHAQIGGLVARKSAPNFLR